MEDSEFQERFPIIDALIKSTNHLNKRKSKKIHHVLLHHVLLQERLLERGSLARGDGEIFETPGGEVKIVKDF
ncbi:MAG: hypothetical protein ACTSRI_12445 [Promethearchaeota archaeon]